MYSHIWLIFLETIQDFLLLSYVRSSFWMLRKSIFFLIYIFLICNNHDDGPWKIHILITIKKKERNKWKDGGNKRGKKLEGLYVGEGFVPKTFRIFEPQPLAYWSWVSPQIQKVLGTKPSPIHHQHRCVVRTPNRTH